jgi:hypothetical protein
MTTLDTYGRTVDQAEDLLLDAMRASDTRQLSALLAEALSFSTPDGSIIGRTADLDAHASGAIQFESLVERERSTIEHAGRARTRSLVDVLVIDRGERIGAALMYERFWSILDGRWQVVAGSANQAG